ncbi:MAG: hypothetical protein ACRC50_09430, partial [Gaiella sp.]
MRDLVLSRRRSLVAFVAGLSAAAVVASADGSPAAHPTQVLTRGAVEAIAVDGNVVAYDVAARQGGCNTVHTWNTTTGVDVVVSGVGTCAADSTSTGAGVRELALAGSRVAWIVNLGGNTESGDTLYAARVGLRGERTVARARRTGSVDRQLDGGWLGNLAADGDLIALNRWTTAGGDLMAASLRVLDLGLGRIREGPSALAVASVAAGRIALSSTGGPVTVLDGTGAVVTDFLPTDEA